VDFAVLRFLVAKIFDGLFERKVINLVAEVTHAGNEEAFTLGEDGGHSVKETRLEWVPAKPVARDVAVQTEVQPYSGRDLRPRMCHARAASFDFRLGGQSRVSHIPPFGA
jgi:hypothetical protein